MVTVNELSIEFDVLYNNITSNQAPGLNGYEKSVFLTKAQSQLISEYFNARIDSSNGGFDNTQKRQYDFSSIITHRTLSQISPNNRFDPRSVSYNLPSDWMFTLNEQLSVQADADSNEELFAIMPVSFDEYNRLMAKPFKFPAKKQAWRLITDTGKVVELIGKIGNKTLQDVNSITYRIRYVKTPSPIILEDLTNYGEDIRIQGQNAPSTLDLPDEFYREILEIV